MKKQNIYNDIPGELPTELVDTLVDGNNVRIERIVSLGHASPSDFWYDQDQDEWVIVLKGEAKLQFQRENRSRHLKPGDFVNIRAHQKHRVEWTSSEEPTVWLAVFY